MKNNQDLLDPKDIGTIKRPKTPKKKEEDISQTIDILGATDIYFKNTNDYIRICGSL